MCSRSGGGPGASWPNPVHAPAPTVAKPSTHVLLVFLTLFSMMGAGAMVGSYYGAKLTGRVRLETLIKTMGVVLLVVGPLLIWQAFRA